MKKKLLVGILVLTMVAACLSVSALAEAGTAELVEVNDSTNLVSNIGEGKSVKVTGAITLTDTLTIAKDKTVTIDLNGNTITGANNKLVIKVESGATLTITDGTSNAAGKIISAGTSCNTITTLGTVNLEKGTIEKGSGVGGYTVFIDGCSSGEAKGVFNMTDGTVTASNSETAKGSNICNDEGTVNISGGTVKAAYNPIKNNCAAEGRGVVTISGTAKIEITNGSGMAIQSNATTIIEGGEIKGDVVALSGTGSKTGEQYRSSLQIKGGKINGNVKVGPMIDKDTNVADVTITDGEITGKLQHVSGGADGSNLTDVEKESVDNNGNFHITGGKFSGGESNIDMFVDPAYSAGENGVVGKNTADTTGVVAKIGDEDFYTSLQGAVDAADSAEEATTITLVSNVETAEGIEITKDKNITIELGTYNITRKGEDDARVISVRDGCKLTLTGTGTISPTSKNSDKVVLFVAAGGELVLDGPTVQHENTTTKMGVIQLTKADGNKIAKATIKSGKVKGSYGISVFAKADLTVNGGTVEGTVYAISTNGTTDSNKTTYGNDAKITVNGGTITGGEAGMYLPSQGGTTTVTGGEIKGTNGAGVVVRGGAIKVNPNEDPTKGPTITAGGSEKQTYGDAASELPPAALVIDKTDSYGQGASANITGGTFHAEKDQSTVVLTNGADKVTQKDDKLNITGGTFMTKGETGDEYTVSDNENVKPYLDSNQKLDENGHIEVDVSNVGVANLNDDLGNKGTGSTLAGEDAYKVTATPVTGTNKVNVVIDASNVKFHYSQGGINCPWVGFSVTAPDGANGVKTAAAWSENELGEATEGTITANVNGEGADDANKGVAFYLNAKNADLVAGKERYYKVEWIDESSKVLSSTIYVVRFGTVTVDDTERQEELEALDVRPAITTAGTENDPSDPDVALCETPDSTLGFYYEVTLSPNDLYKTTSTDSTEESKGDQYYTGFAVVAPEGAENAKVKFDTEEQKASLAQVGNAEADELEVVTTDDEKGVAFYVTVKADDLSINKEWARIQWLDKDDKVVRTDTFHITLDTEHTHLIVEGAEDVAIESAGFKASKEDADKVVTEAAGKDVTDCNDNTFYVSLNDRVTIEKKISKVKLVVKKGTDEVFTEELTSGDVKVFYFRFTENGAEDMGGENDSIAKIGLSAGVYDVQILVNDTVIATSSVEIYKVHYEVDESVTLTNGTPADSYVDKADYVERNYTNLEATTTAENSHVKWDVTIENSVVTVKATSEVNSSSPSGGTVTTTAKVEKTENGSVKLSSTTARAGAEVTVTVTPDKGYELDTLTVTDKNGEAVEVKKNEDGTYSFTMPTATPVTVKATFSKIDPAATFVDVAEDAEDWYLDELLELMVEHPGLINGDYNNDGERVFRPHDSMTRAEFAKIVFVMAGGEAVDIENPFTDMDEGDWYYDYILWACSEGIMGGNGDGTVTPEESITRDQAVAMLHRWAGEPEAEDDAVLDSFPDAAEVEDYAIGAMAWAVEAGVIQGDDTGSINPTDDIQRCEMVAILVRCLDTVAAE